MRLLHKQATKQQQANRAAQHVAAEVSSQIAEPVLHTNRAAQHVAAEVSSQIAEPVLHTARWAMLVALAAFLLACVGIGLAVLALIRG